MTCWKLAEKETDIALVEKASLYTVLPCQNPRPQIHSVRPLPLDELRVGRRRKMSVLSDGMTQENQELLLRATDANPCGHTACSVLDGNSSQLLTWAVPMPGEELG